MGMPVLVTLSSVGQSRAVNLDWMSGKRTSVSVTGSSSGTFAYSIQYALDDIQVTTPSAVSWITDPNATALTSNSSIAFVYAQPLSAVRLNSTALSSAALTMRVLQGIGL
jgi:hypothetical protein